MVCSWPMGPRPPSGILLAAVSQSERVLQDLVLPMKYSAQSDACYFQSQFNDQNKSHSPYLTSNAMKFNPTICSEGDVRNIWWTVLMTVVIQSLGCVRLSATPWTAACLAPLSSTLSRSLLKFMLVELVMLSKTSHPLPPLFLLLSIFPSIRVFSNESASCN